jgi:ring-1,2-phenylacetyl-CoA epoxidase subunit PaaE
MSALHSLAVEKINRLTPSSVAISFKVPSALAADFAFKAGQYLSLEATINGEPVRRSYSLSSAPHENSLTVGIKKIEHGLFSSFANDVLAEGDTLKVASPEGRFVYVPKQATQQLLLIAAGSGITPILSILKTSLEKSTSTTVQLIYGNKSPQETMYQDQLIALQDQYKGRLKITWIYSQSNESNALFGRIDEAIVKYGLKQCDKIPDSTYLCGPEAMIKTAQETLINANINKDSIHFELFTASESAASTSAKPQGKIALSIKADEENYTLESTADKTILDAALQQKIEVPYSCQGGVCCSCIAKVTEGSATMENNQISTNEEIEEGLILTCQAFPTSASITIDYDDV